MLLYSPYALGTLPLANRMVMSPMTRSRATGGQPNELMRLYYRQRAGAGLLIAEGTQTSPFAKGFPAVPGIYTEAHIDGWRLITDDVHAAGGRIFLQLWHCGRISHPLNQPDGRLPIAPSAIVADAFVVLDNGSRVKVESPRALETRELPALLDEFVTAARNAMAAGFDGVEIHAANGYLLHQFLNDCSNQRTDRYGGTISGRIRFVVEVAEAVSAAVGPQRTGIRLSPVNRYNDMIDSDPNGLYATLLPELSRIGLAYVNIVEGEAGVTRDARGFDYAAARRRFTGTWIANNLYDRDSAEAALAQGYADLVSFGRPFIANPDLVERYRLGTALNAVDYSTAYRGGAAGYVDYPSLSQVPGRAAGPEVV